MTELDFSDPSGLMVQLLTQRAEIISGLRCSVCGRRRYSTDDTGRWIRECGANYHGPEPEWSRKDGEQLICWTKPGFCCLNRLARDLIHVRHLRMFTDFCKEHGL